MHGLSKQVADYRSLKATMKQLEEKLTGVEDGIKAHMGDQEEISVDGFTVRWKKVQQNRFDSTEFRKQHAALYEQYLRQSETRRFTIT